jgi:riboflavin synthase
MFTGIVADVGTLEQAQTSAGGSRLRISTRLAGEIGAGDSVSVHGACLTAVAVNGGAFEADVSPQTLSLTGLGELRSGNRVNLELALRASDRLGGHLVQGHVDGKGQVTEVSAEGNSRRLRVGAGSDVVGHLVERGSVALDGVSLTVADLEEDGFEVVLVPETLDRTTLGELRPGRTVNLECDLLARYVRRFVADLSGLALPDEQAD